MLLHTSEFFHNEKCDKSEIAMMYSALRRLHIRGVIDQIYESQFYKEQGEINVT